MNYTKLQQLLGLDKKEIIATLIKPVRIEEIYKKGKVIGFKPGVYGGGHSNWKKDKQQKDGRGMSHAHSFSTFDMHWLKKPKVLIIYDIFTFGKSQHWDWVEVDNCTFEIEEEMKNIKEEWSLYYHGIKEIPKVMTFNDVLEMTEYLKKFIDD